MPGVIIQTSRVEMLMRSRTCPPLHENKQDLLLKLVRAELLPLMGEEITTPAFRSNFKMSRR